MADSMKEHSVKTFQTLCKMLDNNEWNYQKHEEDLVIASEISEDVFKYMLYCSFIAVDEYNDKFYALSKGFLSIEDF